MAVHARLGAVLVAGIAGLATDAAAVVHVVPDVYPTIQAAIDAAASDDTVVVRAGEYGESLLLAGKNLVLIGAGSGSTVIRPPAASRGLRVGPLVTLSAAGVCFAGGTADSGGGVYVGADATCALRSCRFATNSARGPSRNLGGALFANARALIQLRRCEFRDNFADFSATLDDAFGGAVCAVGGAVVDAESTRFVHNVAAGFEGGFGGAVALGGEGYFRHCTFDSNSAGYGGCIGGLGVLSVSQCVFRYNHGVHGASTLFFEGNPYSVQESVFHDNASLAWHTVHMGGTGVVEFNTFAFNEVSSGAGEFACVFWEGSATTVRNNLIVQNRGIGLASFMAPPPGAVSCNDVWLNRDGNYGLACPDLTWQDENLSVNPFFCDSTSRWLHLRFGSACAGGTCGRIGALPEACPGVGVEPAPVGAATELLPARPHPLRGDGVLSFLLPTPAHVRLRILDIAGRRIAEVVEGPLPAGRHELPWSVRGDDGTPIRPGVYVLELEAGPIRRARRLVILGR